MQGEAVLGLEAAGRGLVQPGTPVLNLVSGVFGKGMGYWLKDFGAELHELEVPYNDSVDPADVERYLDEHPEIEVLTVVHCETPSGTLSDVAAIGPMAHSRGVLTIVDCVSSLGGIEFRTDDWQIDIAVAAAQKCLGGPPGITLMTVSDAAWERIRANPSAPRASFLSMLDWKEQWIDGEKFPFTPSVVDMHGIEACVDVVLAEGLDASIARHELCGRAARAGVRAMGLELWPRSDEVTAACVTAIAVPDGLTDIQVRSHCRERYGVMISGGQGAGNLVRIGHMGPTARSLYPVVGSAGGRPHVCRPRRPREARGRRRGCAGGALGDSARHGMTLPPFELHRPRSLEEATELATRYGEDAAFYCGGTELLLLLKLGFATFGHLVDIKGIEELRGVRAENGTLVVGAAVTHRELERSAVVHERLPALARDGTRRRQPSRPRGRHARREPLLLRPPLGSGDVPARGRRRGRVPAGRRAGAPVTDRRLRRRAVPDKPRAG